MASPRPHPTWTCGEANRISLTAIRQQLNGVVAWAAGGRSGGRVRGGAQQSRPLPRCRQDRQPVSLDRGCCVLCLCWDWCTCSGKPRGCKADGALVLRRRAQRRACSLQHVDRAACGSPVPVHSASFSAAAQRAWRVRVDMACAVALALSSEEFEFHLASSAHTLPCQGCRRSPARVPRRTLCHFHLPCTRLHA